MYSTNETKLFKSVHTVIIIEIQTKWTKFRPNLDHYWAIGLNSDRLRKIRPEWQQWVWSKYIWPSRNGWAHRLGSKLTFLEGLGVLMAFLQWFEEFGREPIVVPCDNDGFVGVYQKDNSMC